jgi:hypothetical protein
VGAVQLSIANIKCSDYGLTLNHIFESGPPTAKNGLFLSDLERTRLQEKLEKLAKHDEFFESNYDYMLWNVTEQQNAHLTQLT